MDGRLRSGEISGHEIGPLTYHHAARSASPQTEHLPNLAFSSTFARSFFFFFFFYFLTAILPDTLL